MHRPYILHLNCEGVGSSSKNVKEKLTKIMKKHHFGAFSFVCCLFVFCLLSQQRVFIFLRLHKSFIKKKKKTTKLFKIFKYHWKEGNETVQIRSVNDAEAVHCLKLLKQIKEEFPMKWYWGFLRVDAFVSHLLFFIVAVNFIEIIWQRLFKCRKRNVSMHPEIMDWSFGDFYMKMTYLLM